MSPDKVPRRAEDNGPTVNRPSAAPAASVRADRPPAGHTPPAGSGGDFSRVPVPARRRAAAPGQPDGAARTALAKAATSDSGQTLPHLRRIQESFGAHDVSGVRAHLGPVTSDAARTMGAAAFAVGRDVGFGAAPDLFTAAHEAAHCVQQRGSVSLRGGAIAAGDPHERHADLVARAVVDGRSCEALLDRYTRPGAEVPAASPPVQLLELTYDDGPDPTTRKTLDALVKGGAKATFYVVGHKVNTGDNWRIVFDIAAAGNWLGNHAYDWDDAKDNHIFMSGTPYERAAKILQTEFAIRDALVKGKADAQAGKTWETIPQANRDYIDDVIAKGTGRFRTPGFKSHFYSAGGGEQKRAIELASQAMESAGLRRFVASDSVDIDSKDWEKGKTQADVESSVTARLSSDSDSILLHSRLGISAAATPAIVESIKKKGLTFQAPSRGAIGAGTGGFSDVGTSAEWVDSFSAVSGIGPPTTVNRTDPVDRTVTTQRGIAWIDYGQSKFLAVITIENSSIARGTTILFIAFVHQDLKARAVARATPHQPRGIQTIPKQSILLAPATPTPNAATP